VIGVVLPSRGAILSETVESLLENIKDIPSRVYISHNLPIPDSFNQLTDKALADEPTHLFFMNDDVVLGKNMLKNMLQENKPVVVGHCRINDGYDGFYEQNGEITMCGTACLLVRADVFKKLDKPYFRTDIMYDFNTWTETQPPKNPWGGEDAYFCKQLRDAGYKIELVPDRARHLNLKALGNKKSNNGCHTIEEL